MGDWLKALQISEQLYEHAKKTSEVLYIFGSLDQMAWPQSYLGMTRQALENRTRSAEMRRAIGGGIIADWFDAGEAEILLNAGRPAEALDFYKQVLNQKLTDEQRNDVMKSVKKAIDKQLAEQQRVAATAQQSNSPAHVDAAPLLVNTPAPPPKPVYRKGWFWGTIGAVVAAGVIVGVTVGVLTRNNMNPAMNPVVAPPDGATAF